MVILPERVNLSCLLTSYLSTLVSLKLASAKLSLKARSEASRQNTSNFDFNFFLPKKPSSIFFCSYKEGCKPENTRDEGPKGDASLGPSWRDSRKKEPWRRGGQDDNDKFSDFRNDGNNGPGGGSNKYGNRDNRDNRYGNNGPNNRFGNSNRGGNNRYGRYGRDSPDEEPEWMNPDDANEITFMSLEGLPGDMRGKIAENRPNKNRDSPELVAFDENAFMGTTDDGDGNIGGVLGAALGELDDGDELGGALEDDPKMDGLIKSSFMDIMKDDDNDSVGAAAPKSSASKFSAFFDAGPELKPPTTTQKPAGATVGFPPPQNIGVPAGLIPPTAAGLGMNVPAPNQPLGLNLWNIQQAGNPNSSANSHPTPEQQMKQQSAENSRVNNVFSQLQNPKGNQKSFTTGLDNLSIKNRLRDRFYVSKSR